MGDLLNITLHKATSGALDAKQQINNGAAVVMMATADFCVNVNVGRAIQMRFDAYVGHYVTAFCA